MLPTPKIDVGKFLSTSHITVLVMQTALLFIQVENQDNNWQNGLQVKVKAICSRD